MKYEEFDNIDKTLDATILEALDGHKIEFIAIHDKYVWFSAGGETYVSVVKDGKLQKFEWVEREDYEDE